MDDPPLGYLRAFEAAARHESFARAAQELNLTPAAVSQQMRALERRLSVALFKRHPRSLSLTSAGRSYAAQIRRALREIRAATLALEQPERAGQLNIATFQSFASMWLVDRLPAFRSSYPEIDLRLKVASDLHDLDLGEAEIAIRFGPGTYDGCKTECLFNESVIAVCSPTLLAGRPVPQHVRELTTYPLIHDQSLLPSERYLRWNEWVPEGSTATHLFMPDGLLAYQAAKSGQGIALVRRKMVDEDLSAGRLIWLLNEERPLEFGYWLVTRTGADHPRVAAFTTWIKSLCPR